MTRERFASLSQGNAFVFADQIWDSTALNQCSMTRKFYLGFWKTSKKTHTKLQNNEKVYQEFQGLPCFPEKLALYLSTKFGIIKPWKNIQSLRRFHLPFWQTSKETYKKVQ